MKNKIEETTDENHQIIDPSNKWSTKIQQEQMRDFKKALALTPEKFLIVSDLDGTLLNCEGEITDYTKKVIKILNKHGHKFCIATGRPWRSAKPFYDQLELNTLIANLNGSIVHKPYDQYMVPINYVFSSDILRQLCEDQEILNVIENIILEDGHSLRTYAPLDEKHIEDLSRWFHFDLKKDRPSHGFEEVFQTQRNIPSILIQLSISVDIDYIISLIKSKVKTMTCQMWSLNDKSKILEVNTVFANKGNALEFFSSYYGIPLDKSIAFGDGYNDVSLVSKAHYGYAMKNGKTTAKFVARGVTPFDNGNDGVARKIQEFFINRLKEKSYLSQLEANCKK
ncbi:Cof subfamily protein (haloacid dehalogenase superfamily) [Mycoplasmoides fastidiosum]|uniref:Cof subfamily protein (Haloacid dehalogenase superfamily) n=1 Tax=Mycoplasmoides fastidiosum TaxID=92758 RepID=A0ABU0LZ72_9BACT|nr:Cof-type HAD-IIB family hydrolase [Mycoplasmoides fastidiosum]MDQ0513885.1 Cof subfamily protein (haloacid dehalogenase superfamily) [Mycoplasmoides fastidiosum]UUD37701.1 Cof-type HAD-IIB family hydrolase [Mycoplasmoides fastidiosum]